ncbi:hypothetical protein D9757_003462 [Collybiopsis confluens]|uniref:Uncharacterized protein n=1 Tax=Collybiopsis confluens TaxID=2823264 RepID=A0A8H5HU37_9AGAR|nr:hypothetical protein D9757_003462 [Collybiopsis confluens]
MDSTYGAAFVGLILSTSLYGATILQTYLYYRHYPKDSIYIKLLVLALWLLDTTQLVLCVTAMYWYLITNYDSPPALQKLTWQAMNILRCGSDCAAGRMWVTSTGIGSAAAADIIIAASLDLL